jgi:hypothetical protein
MSLQAVHCPARQRSRSGAVEPQTITHFEGCQHGPLTCQAVDDGCFASSVGPKQTQQLTLYKPKVTLLFDVISYMSYRAATRS